MKFYIKFIAVALLMAAVAAGGYMAGYEQGYEDGFEGLHGVNQAELREGIELGRQIRKERREVGRNQNAK